MKKILFPIVIAFSLTLSFTNCSKTKEVSLKYPQTVLIGSNWRSSEPVRVVLGSKVYEHLYFINETSIQISSVYADGKLIGNKDNYLLEIRIDPKGRNIDIFEVSVENGRIRIGSTTENINLISLDNYQYTRQ